jgi:outer membrane lipoprotein carrier protein
MKTSSRRSPLAAAKSLAFTTLLLTAACNGSDKPDLKPAPSGEHAMTSASAALSAAPMVSASAAPTVSATASAATSAAAPPVSATASAAVAPVTPKPSSKPVASAAPSASASASAAAMPALPPPEAGSAEEVANKIDGLYVPKPTYSAKFTQEYTIKTTGQVKNSTGVVFCQRPNKISFRYEGGNKNRVVSDGTTFKIYTAEDNQMIEQPVAKNEMPGALSFLMGKGLRPSFTFRFNDKVKSDIGPVLYGKPRDASPFYEYVQFYIDKGLLEKTDPGAVAKVLIVDAQGNKNKFEFTDAKFPATVDPSEFIFTPPAGTDIKKSP